MTTESNPDLEQPLVVNDSNNNEDLPPRVPPKATVRQLALDFCKSRFLKINHFTISSRLTSHIIEKSADSLFSSCAGTTHIGLSREKVTSQPQEGWRYGRASMRHMMGVFGSF